MSQGERLYECIVLGATGYTGKYTAEHITTHLPTDFKWAIAGRSESKLQTLANDLKHLSHNRQPPSIEVCQLDKAELLALAKKTKVLLTTIGPYHLHGTPVLAACAETGTHYVDVTGEVPWHYEMVQKYDAVAKSTNAIIIPQNGIESAPADLLAWAMVQRIRSDLETGTGDCIVSLHDMKAAPSGGTLATVLTLFDTYSLADFRRTQDPYCLSPITPQSTNPSSPVSWTERLTGVRSVPDLGTLTDSLSRPADVPIINRSWALIQKGTYYGPSFRFQAYGRARNFLQGFLTHLALALGVFALILPPVRWLLLRFVTQAGDGPTRESVKSDFAEWRAIAQPDTNPADTTLPRAHGRMYWGGGLYHLTGVCLAESALVLAREKTWAHELGGGLMTPACLGEPYVERLKEAGLKLETRMRG
ncbi:hypothetical protein MBLNU230_g8054t1 [Neophaeotheca triangularis]